jgi:competence protein ComEA
MKIGWPQLIGGLVAAVLLVGVGYGVATLRRGTQPTPIEIVPPPSTATVEPTNAVPPTPTAGLAHVYVTGAVVAPAVYTLPPGSLIDDAVKAAGGFAAGADVAAVNLALTVSDGMQIHVPLMGEQPTPPPISQPADGPTAPAVRMGGVTVDGLININTAGQSDLEMLPGIGPSTAADIIAYREANGPFAAIEAIMDVPGIGEGKFEAMRDLITVGP